MEASKENIGSSSEVISCLIDITGMTQDEIVHHFKADGVLSTSRHEYILQLRHLIEKGSDTFGTIEAFRGWLSCESIGMDARPIDIINTATGIQLVFDELIRIDYGITV
jgi:uncharacterized protein (DUF2384 family)